MDQSIDIMYVACSLYVVSLLSNREEYLTQKEELDDLKTRTITRLHEKQYAKKLGLYSTPQLPDIVVLYSLEIPQTDEIFYFFLPHTDIEFHTLPTLDDYFKNPKPKYIPALYFAIDSLKKFLSITAPKLVKKKKTKKAPKGTQKLDRSIFVSSYLDGRPLYQSR
ncbi:YkyB family protein [Alkalihalobacterium bogoriense]|uniref:YkyB family protein n=1 Tax=Alkalihalobacterium bogoriense TaxID=246272 RepID=UPI00047D0EF0|nr:YkyB family protein [Alkalihalobacterium bogoriense]